MHNAFLQAAIKAAQLSKSIHQYYSKIGFTTSSKSAICDVVTTADQEAEKAIKKSLFETFPKHGFLGEETGEEEKRSDYRWVIDPLDGTLNFSRGFPFYCTSIALEHMGKVIVGVVLDSNLDELFFAVEDQGAYLNGKQLHVSNVKQLDSILISTGFSPRLEDFKKNIGYANAVLNKGLAIRRAGSAALDLAYVAAGRQDAFWELFLKPWDVAAGSLLVKEAGGMITTLENKEHHLISPSIVGSNGHIHNDLLKLFGF
ncbi:MAG: Inositol-1-monophosphatase [Chlamydiae bacterium]|nr:Inositol-1-monophosphatase [Chlamydiota bacterium]